jgi:RsiW-degrading membrane proteinase PrsW (M82 family)
MPVHRHAWLAALIVGVALFAADQQALAETDNPNFVPSVILLGAAVVPAAFVLFIAARHLPYDVPPWLVFSTALLSGVIGTIAAGMLEFQTLQHLGVLPMVAVAVIEESAKLAVPLAILLLTRYRRPADGLLIGVAAGAGFAALETMGYAFVALVVSHGNLIALEDILVLRGLLSPAGHMAWTGATATALWTAHAWGRGGHGWGLFAGVFVAVVILHTVWDSVGTLAGYFIVAAVSLALLGWLTHRTATRGEAFTRRCAPYQPSAGHR